MPRMSLDRSFACLQPQAIGCLLSILASTLYKHHRDVLLKRFRQLIISKTALLVCRPIMINAFFVVENLSFLLFLLYLTRYVRSAKSAHDTLGRAKGQ